MRVNVYGEEITDRVELVRKTVDGVEFVGVRFYLELPVTTSDGEVSGPFIHRLGDDDSSAITFWSKHKLLPVLKRAAALIEDYYEQSGSERSQG